MHFVTAILASEVKVPIIFPSYVFGIIAGCIFLFFGVVTWTYRDVANRHSNRAAAQYHDDHEHGHAGSQH